MVYENFRLFGFEEVECMSYKIHIKQTAKYKNQSKHVKVL